jgi:hypothetical protein
VTGPNPKHLASSTASITAYTYPGGNAKAAADSRASNQYQFQLETRVARQRTGSDP